MKASELRDQNIEQLELLLEDTKKELYEIRTEFKMTNKLEKPHLISHKKKDIAKILTIIKEKQGDRRNA